MGTYIGSHFYLVFMEDNTRNIYIIKRRLAELKMDNYSSYLYHVGQFTVRILPPRSEGRLDRNYPLTQYDKFDVLVRENTRTQEGIPHRLHIYLEEDTRFSNYTPIKYNEFPGLSNGIDMPLLHLCELVKYLHRLSNLSVFS